jgi:hypothetical protein
LNPKHFIIPKSNLWLRRIILVFTFILFDYFSTLCFCQKPFEEANLFVRTFMENLGIPLGLTLFVLLANLPIYLALSLDSHIVRLPRRLDRAIELGVDGLFAWFVAGTHFSGGASWFWYAPDFARQALGAFLYIAFALLLVKPHKPRYTNTN